jgi:hypothetical protein
VKYRVDPKAIGTPTLVKVNIVDKKRRQDKKGRQEEKTRREDKKGRGGRGEEKGHTHRQ